MAWGAPLCDRTPAGIDPGADGCRIIPEHPPGAESPEPEPVSPLVYAIIGIGSLFILLLGIHPDRILTLAGYSSLALK